MPLTYWRRKPSEKKAAPDFANAGRARGKSKKKAISAKWLYIRSTYYIVDIVKGYDNTCPYYMGDNLKEEKTENSI